MQVNTKIVKEQRTKNKEQRTKRAWSQSQLAVLTGLSLRTVQRIESSGTASLESVKAICAIFELAPEFLQLDEITNQKTKDSNEILVSPSQVNASFKLSNQAIQFSAALFIPASIAMLMMVFTKLPNVDWVNSTRMMLFSDTLPKTVGLTINVIIALMPIFLLSVMTGVCLDIYKQQGAFNYFRRLKNRPKSLKLLLEKFRENTHRAVTLFKKPVLFSVLFLILAIGAIGLTMEPYQKANLKQFIAQVL